MPAASLRALLAHSIDYAGLFPPANLSLEPALRNQAEYVRLPDAWMLGAFILPASEFDAAARDLSQFESRQSLRISALGPKTEHGDAFQAAISSVLESIGLFRSRGGGVVSIEQLEMPLPAKLDVDSLGTVRAALGDARLKTFWEAPANTAEGAIRLIAESNAESGGGKLGFKLRTGGVTAEAFPSSAQIASALVAAGREKVPIKFTAGLHHPIRLFHESVRTKMHGFLNVLGAGVLGLEHNWSEKQTAAMLEDENPASFSFQDDLFSWRDWKIASEQIVAQRELVTSFGSCSFDEPRDDLRALKLL